MFLMIMRSPPAGGGGDLGSAMSLAYCAALGASATVSMPRGGTEAGGAKKPEVLGENRPALGENRPPLFGASRTNTWVWTRGSQLFTLRGIPLGLPNAGSTDWNFCRNGNGRGDRLRFGDRFPLSLVLGRDRRGGGSGIDKQSTGGACAEPWEGG